MRSISEVLNDRYGPDPGGYTTVLASASRTAITTSANFLSYGRGLKLFINATALSLTPSVTFSVYEVDPFSGAVSSTAVITSAAIVATGLTILTIYPGLTPAANTVVSNVAPRLYRVVTAVADTDPLTYSVSAISLQ